MGLNISALEKANKNLIIKILKDKMRETVRADNVSLVDLFFNEDVEVKVLDIEWLLPFHASKFELNSPTDRITFFANFKITPKDKSYSFDSYIEKNILSKDTGKSKKLNVRKGESFYAIISGAINFSKLSNNNIQVSPAVGSIQMFQELITKNKKVAQSEFNYLNRKIQKVKRFDSKQDKDEYLTDKIETLNMLDEEGLLDQEAFMERFEAFLSLHDMEEERVWGEYNLVSRRTNQPELMNKAMAIRLNKKQVVNLVKMLSEDYEQTLKSEPRTRKFFTRHGMIPIEFTTTDRGHADPTTRKINLPKLGDWRTGYDGNYSAEVVFHEFAHIIDFNRQSMERNLGRKTARAEVHDMDFTRILDNMLLNYSDYINSKYDFEEHKSLILNNRKDITRFVRNKKDIIYKEALKEKEIRANKKSREDENREMMGIDVNSSPLTIILPDESKKILIDLIRFVIKKGISSSEIMNKQKNHLRIIKKALTTEDVRLSKDEMKTLLTAVKMFRKDHDRSLGFQDRLKHSTAIMDFVKNLEKLIDGSYAKQPKEDVVIEHYDDTAIIPDEQERLKIVGY